MLLPLALLSVQVAILPTIATEYSLYFGLAFPATLLPLVFRSKAETPLYWLLWVVLMGASLYYTYLFYIVWGVLQMFSDHAIHEVACF
ncbi:MAG: hypothetical protein EOO60_01985 [Hymenobacter sp.]|nr:MAG: hypothetical protein EOO60_01985 [Hymenobacter sp.]